METVSDGHPPILSNPKIRQILILTNSELKPSRDGHPPILSNPKIRQILILTAHRAPRIPKVASPTATAL